MKKVNITKSKWRQEEAKNEIITYEITPTCAFPTCVTRNMTGMQLHLSFGVKLIYRGQQIHKMQNVLSFFTVFNKAMC